MKLNATIRPTVLIKRWTLFFIISISLSGITAFVPAAGLEWILSLYTSQQGETYNFLRQCYQAIETTSQAYPFLLYGYDWLAFGHFVIGLFFIGVYNDPIRNEWIVKAGLLACMLVIPAAFIAGAARGIPIWWRFIDCSFGVIGSIPLLICYRKIQQLKQLVHSSNPCDKNSAADLSSAYYNVL